MVFLFNVITKVLQSPNLDMHLGGPGTNIPLGILVVMKKKIKKVFGSLLSHGCPRVYWCTSHWPNKTNRLAMQRVSNVI